MKCPYKKIKIIDKESKIGIIKEIIDFAECDATQCMAFENGKCIKLKQENNND